MVFCSAYLCTNKGVYRFPAEIPCLATLSVTKCRFSYICKGFSTFYHTYKNKNNFLTYLISMIRKWYLDTLWQGSEK